MCVFCGVSDVWFLGSPVSVLLEGPAARAPRVLGGSARGGGGGVRHLARPPGTGVGMAASKGNKCQGKRIATLTGRTLKTILVAQANETAAGRINNYFFGHKVFKENFFKRPRELELNNRFNKV